MGEHDRGVRAVGDLQLTLQREPVGGLQLDGFDGHQLRTVPSRS